MKIKNKPSEFAEQLFLAIIRKSSRRTDNLGISPKTQLRPQDLEWLYEEIGKQWALDHSFSGDNGENRNKES